MLAKIGQANKRDPQLCSPDQLKQVYDFSPYFKLDSDKYKPVEIGQHDQSEVKEAEEPAGMLDVK